VRENCTGGLLGRLRRTLPGKSIREEILGQFGKFPAGVDVKLW